MLRHLILGLLRHNGPRHGYALMKEYRDTSGREINVGNFYREFQRLQLEGLVRPVRNPIGADSRRVPYEITDRGIAEFDTWLARPGAGVAVDYENDYSLRAFFVLQATHALAKHVLDNWHDELNAQQRLFQTARDEALFAGQADEPSGPTSTLSLWLGRRLNHIAIDQEFVELLRTRCAPPCAMRPTPTVAASGRTPSRRAS